MKIGQGLYSYVFEWCEQSLLGCESESRKWPIKKEEGFFFVLFLEIYIG